jgi:hypothetical protein
VQKHKITAIGYWSKVKGQRLAEVGYGMLAVGCWLKANSQKPKANIQ